MIPSLFNLLQVLSLIIVPLAYSSIHITLPFVEKVLPEIVDTRDNGYKAVKYEKMVALLIEAVKDQQKQIDELKEIRCGCSR